MQPDNAKPPLRFRKLRIAWSVFWGVACVLLIALWVRSYFRRDVVGGTLLSYECVLESANGNVAVLTYYLNPAYSRSRWGWNTYGPKSTGFGTSIPGQFLLKDYGLIILVCVLAVLPWLNAIASASKRTA